MWYQQHRIGEVLGYYISVAYDSCLLGVTLSLKIWIFNTKLVKL
jgi:hypothetical protein